MSSSQVTVAIGAGSNLGDREQHLAVALADLEEVLDDARRGGLYCSQALGGGGEPDYLNTAVVGRTHLDPEPLLAVLKFLEYRAGRRQGPRWGSRPLDLDLLLYGGIVRDNPELTLPHPGLRLRAFVLAPLADAAPGLRLPPDGATVERLLARAEGLEGLEARQWQPSPPHSPP